MISGVTQKEYDIIKGIIKKYPYNFYAYGSRVKGNYTRGSDLDILIKSNEAIKDNIIENLNLEFNKSLIPYKVNFSIYSELSKGFYDLIEKDLVEIV